MVKYRKKLRIIAEILSITSKGAKKTQIMYRANLSYKLLCRYLVLVLDAGLVSFERRLECYRITRKGQEFLQQFSEYSRRYNQLVKQMNGVNNKRMVLKEMISNPNKQQASKKEK